MQDIENNEVYIGEVTEYDEDQDVGSILVVSSQEKEEGVARRRFLCPV